MQEFSSRTSSLSQKLEAIKTKRNSDEIRMKAESKALADKQRINDDETRHS
jgi:hypothetical protein